MESLEFAIKMELDGEKFYMEQANKHQDSDLHIVFEMLARDERNHAKILKHRAELLPPNLSETTVYDEYKNIFQRNNDSMLSFKASPEQVDIYLQALDNEAESIKLYKEMLAGTTNERDIKIFEFLIKEEERHHDVLEGISSHVIQAREWVESAEFGLREEY